MSLVPTSASSTDLASPQPPSVPVAAAFLLGYEAATRAAYEGDLRAWFSWCVDHDLDPLTAQRVHVDAYSRTLGEIGPKPADPKKRPKPVKPATIARHLSTLSGFYRYAVAEEVVARNPVANVR